MRPSELAYDILNVALSLCSVLNNRKGAISALCVVGQRLLMFFWWWK